MCICINNVHIILCIYIKGSEVVMVDYVHGGAGRGCARVGWGGGVIGGDD